MDINILVGEESEADFIAEVDEIASSGEDLSDDVQVDVFEFSELCLDDSADGKTRREPFQRPFAGFLRKATFGDIH